jgi:hypothetical protein
MSFGEAGMSNHHEAWIDWVGSRPRTWSQWLAQSALGGFFAALWWLSGHGSSFKEPGLWVSLTLGTGVRLLLAKAGDRDA